MTFRVRVHTGEPISAIQSLEEHFRDGGVSIIQLGPVASSNPLAFFSQAQCLEKLGQKSLVVAAHDEVPKFLCVPGFWLISGC